MKAASMFLLVTPWFSQLVCVAAAAEPMSPRVDEKAWAEVLETSSPHTHLDFITHFPDSKYARLAVSRLFWLLEQRTEAAGPAWSISRRVVLRPLRRNFLPAMIRALPRFPPRDVDHDPLYWLQRIDRKWWLHGLPAADRDRLHQELLAGYLTHLVDAEDDALRSRTCRALGYFGDPTALKPLILAAEDGGRSNSAEYLAIGELQDPRAKAVLLARLERSPDPATIDALAALGDPSIGYILRDLTHSKQVEVRQRSCEAIGLIGYSRGLPWLIDRAKDQQEDESVRRAAIEALGRIGNAHAVPTLACLIPAENLYDQVIQALGMIRDDTSIRLLANDVVEKRDLLAMTPSLALAGCEHPDSVPALMAALYSSGVSHLSFTGANSGRDLIFNGAEEEYRRYSCGKCVSRVWSYRSIDRLLIALRNENESICGGAAYSVGLAPVADPRAVDAIVPLLSDNALAASAAYALGCLGESRAVEPLVDVLGRDNDTIRRFAAHALGQIGDTRAVGPLLRLLNDEDMGFAVTQALGYLGGQEAVRHLTRKFKDMPISDTGKERVQQEPLEEEDAWLGPSEFLSESDERQAPVSTTESLPQRTTRQDVLRALWQTGDPAAIPILREIAGNWQDPLHPEASRLLAGLDEASDPENQVPAEAAAERGYLRYPTNDSLKETITDPHLATLEGAGTLRNLTVNMQLPGDADEAVRYMILASEWIDLIAIWPRTMRVLFHDLRSRSRDRQLYAARCLIRIGYGEETIPELVATLDSSDDERMAHDFINSGNERLRQAAMAWSQKTGKSLDSHRPKELTWGAMSEP